MNRTTRNILVVVVVLCLAYPLMAWAIGFRIQAKLLHDQQLLQERLPGRVSVISNQIHRGIFLTTQDIVYGFGPESLRGLAPLAGAFNPAALRITVHNTIHHGPFPEFRSLAMATSSVRIELPPDLSAKLGELLGGEPVVQIRGSSGWFGSSSADISSPAFEGRRADGTQVSWHAFEAKGTTNAALTHSTMDGALKDFAVKARAAQVEMNGLQGNFDWRTAFESLYTGPFSMSIATIKIQPAASPPYLMQGLAFKGSGSVDGDFYSATDDLGFDSLQTPTLSVTHADYAIAFEHLHAPTLAALMKDLAKLRGGGAPPAQQGAAFMQAMQENLADLMAHAPVINVTHVGFTMPEGDLRLSAKIAVPGLTQEDLKGNQAPAAVLKHLDVVADLRVDAKLLMRLMASNPRTQDLSSRIDDLERRGYIKRDGTAYTVHLTFSDGKTAMNGKAFPPTAGN